MSPKERISKSPRLKEIASLLNSPLLEELTEAAMLTFVENTPAAQDAQSAMAYHHQLEGAKRYLRTLRGLAMPVPEPKLDTSGQLRHDV